ncbi:DNA primase [Renibacterium salmoninarum ATCC 33209]|uniref:DNA primase n=1 Tax=Renibacterium salmoninarum (strain ATCC 33209 / DSM 20767 / JCM 11484 / NBRC 15589 / NCIMB 2235) TaxID=288705 RepID=A9WTV7_RENSM|nr:DNA primase [Renibacterium salmoninarum]ABY24628.1 DNA primase [Renibacterium salmoninarum ATCC 33209]
MAGLIKQEDIEELRARTDIKEVVEGYVTLKSAGVGSWKGLCPFHDERSPSFNVRPQVGRYHCFGCGEGGDVISFVQKVDHLSFSETVEKLAARIGFELHYEDGGSGPRREETGRRQRLLDAHKVAAEFFRDQLLTPGAAAGRQFLSGRGFDRAAAEQFGVGFAPQGWDGLLKHLRGQGYSDEELRLTGMFSTGSSGDRLFDRFRGRLIWPIRDIAGETIGFGARKLFEEDQGPKYLNTPETILYKKSHVLYGIDLAKKAISKGRQLVVVEGYTDVMACHLSGVGTAVATCGTAFGEDHIKVARRLLSDDGTGGEVIFTFDGDAAGQNAALKAFSLDQRFVAQTYVAVEPSGQDPCDLRQSGGSEAVQALIASRRPLFEFAIRSALSHFDLSAVEGRVQGLRAAAPVVAEIRDGSTRVGYSQELAGWLGIADPNEVLRAVTTAAKNHTRSQQKALQAQPGQTESTAAPNPAQPLAFNRTDPRDPAARMERQGLEVVLQQPALLSEADWLNFNEIQFVVPAYRAVHEALHAAGRPSTDTGAWLQKITEEAPEPLRPLVSELSMTPLPASNDEGLLNYCRSMLRSLLEMQLTRAKAEKLGALQRMDPALDPAGYQQLQRELMQLEVQRRVLREE